jgi:16S rRNA (uracil1498-N3)-methyltransferase
LNLFYQPLIRDGVDYLDADESKHAIRVMRKRIGDTVHITDGSGTLYDARIRSEDQHKCLFEIIATTSAPEPDHHIHIAISPLNHPDRLEWFVEKAVELGVHRITLIVCTRTEKRYPKHDRLQKIAIGAMKQSLRFTLPAIEGPLPFDAFVTQCKADQRYIAYVDTTNPVHLMDEARRGSTYVVLIGPEGDFTGSELNHALTHGFVKVSLGTSRLRTETAGLATCHTLNLVNSR